MYKKNQYNYKQINNHYLITNEYGCYSFLSDKEFKKLENNEKLPISLTKKLKDDLFIYEDEQSFKNVSKCRIREYKRYLEESTVLHIFVVSKNCNYNCVYCQAGNLSLKEDFLMNEYTAQKALDIALESPSQELTFEFQGGEPLTNFSIIKHIIEYSKEKNEKLKEKKNITYNIVTNLSLLNEEIASYIVKNSISVCTSIDGPCELQNKNMPYKDNDSYKVTIYSFKKLKEQDVTISALLTTTRYSFDKYKEIVDEYVSLGLNRIWIRPLTKLGKAEKNWEDISYSADEFLEFYKKTLDYIIQVNKKGYLLIEGLAGIMLSKIINQESVNFMELRSPCGAGIGQLAYYYDGDIYTCDEGRMLAEMGDKKFLLGNVLKSNFKDLIESEITKEASEASCLECSKICHSCVYMPYCGTCPVLNYARSGKMELDNKEDYKCKINSGILDILFSYIQKDKSVLKIFKNWI